MSLASAPLARSAAAAERWWVEAQGRVWGPYPAARMEAFAGEGRLGASSLVGPSPRGPFAPAALDPAFTRLFVPDAAPSPAEAPTGARAESPASQPGARRAVLVFAALQTTRADLFEAALAAQGDSVRVAPGLWVVAARCAAAPLRNALSRRLREGDVLVVSELDAARAAWFAVPGETDRALRRLMAG